MIILKNKNQVWHDFDHRRGYRQKRPAIGKYVLVKVQGVQKNFPNPILVAYRKNAAGDTTCPYFVIPGGTEGLERHQDGTGNWKILAWCDCLPEDFKYPYIKEHDDRTLVKDPSDQSEVILCTICNREIKWHGKYWKHEGMQPRHPAIPKDKGEAK